MNIQLADLRIIGTIFPSTSRTGFGIRATVHEVYLLDGSIHRLHLVLERGAPAKYLRALQSDTDHRLYHVFDLRHLSTQLGEDLLTCADRDVAGLVSFSLRALLPSRASFVHEVRFQALAHGRLVEAEAVA